MAHKYACKVVTDEDGNKHAIATRFIEKGEVFKLPLEIYLEILEISGQELFLTKQPFMYQTALRDIEKYEIIRMTTKQIRIHDRFEED